MQYVLAYQKAGTNTIDSYDIPDGKEQAFDTFITGKEEVTFKDGLRLNRDEIKGIFTLAEFESFKQAFFTKEIGPGLRTFLELGKALKEKQSLEKWKRATTPKP